MNEQQDLIPQTEDDADALLESIEQPAGEMPEPGVNPQQEAAQANQASEFAFTVGGKEIKLDLAKDREKLIRWAQQGYEAPNKIGELNKTLEGYKSKEQQFKEWQERFGPVDEYVRQNPEWWSHVQSQYEQLQAQRQADPNNPIIDQLAKRLEGLEGLASSLQTERQAERAKLDDQKYMEEFQTIQKQYPKIDFATPDESGKSLEYKVLEFANTKGIKEFTTAFKAYHHDELMKLAAEEAKEKVIQDKQSKSKLGILGMSPTPTRRISDSVKGKSYADLEREALAELGLA